MSETRQTTRRRFLQGVAAAGTACVMLRSANRASGYQSPNDRPVFATIGLRNQGWAITQKTFQFADFAALADVDSKVLAINVEKTEQKQGKKPDAYKDYRQVLDRKDIDAVMIATPDHWHTVIAVAALRGGKDVYCEKPLTHNIHESLVLLREVDANGRVLQTGSMQRSSKEFRVACELVLNGAIGKVERVECSFGGPPVPCDLAEEPMEPGLDWNLWVGPAGMRPYNSALSPRGVHKHYPAWRSYREFGGGGVADWGAHHLDIAQWGLGMDGSGPVEILPPEKSGASQGAKFIYANGVVLEHKGGFGVDFFGTEGEVQVNRGRFTFRRGTEMIASFTGQRDTSCAAQVQRAEQEYLKDPKVRLYESKDHLNDFLECVKTRKKPITSEQVKASARRSAAT